LPTLRALARSPNCIGEGGVTVSIKSVRLRRTLRVTPAMAAGVSDRLWSLEELVDRTTG
jgi:hypothetical protein